MANEYLKRTPTSTGNRKVFTWSAWVKRNSITNGSPQSLFTGGVNGSDRGVIDFDDVDTVRFGFNNSSSWYLTETTDKFRDTGSWMNVIVSVDLTTSGNEDVSIYVNGIKRSSSAVTWPSIVNNTYNEAGYGMYITSTYGQLNAMYKGEMIDVFWVDGQALTPDVFGFYKEGKGYISAGSTQATDFRPGQWVPKTPRVIKAQIERNGGFGVNGFYLPMNDSSNFGADFHCEPNSIIKLGEDLPQPKVSIASTAQAGLAYTDVLRADSYASNLVLAVPGIGTIRDYSPFINSTLSGVGMTATIDDAGGGIDVGLGTVSVYYGEAIYKPVRDGSTIDYTPRTSTTAYGTQWTIEFWCNIEEPTAGYQIVYHHADTGAWSNGIVISRHDTNDAWTIWANGTSNCTGGRFTSVTDSWQHIAAVRDGSKLSLFQNGVCIGINTNYSGTDTTSAGRPIGILGEPGTNNYGSRGYVQDLRVYIGTAKYKGGFDVPKPYTPVGIATWRAVPDCTANNFATLNPLQGDANYHSDGNLKLTSNDTTYRGCSGTIGFKTGKWYIEVNVGTYNYDTGIALKNLDTPYGYYYLAVNGHKWDTSTTSTSYGSSYTSGDIIGIAFDADTRTLTFYKNGVSQGVAFSGMPSGTYIFQAYTAGTGANIVANFGQNPTFSGNTTAGTYTDSNGKGLFKYEPPSGFLALCEDNLPTPAISDPGEYFKTVLYTGTGSSRNVVGVGFTPDLVWIKERTSTSSHHLFDSVRGPGLNLLSDSTAAEAASSTQLYSFDSDGFSGGSSGGTNESGQNYVAWCWRAGAGTTSTNTDGSIQSVVSVNQDAGFSIVSYTGTGANATVGHGLGKSPAFAIVKVRNLAGESWNCFHKTFSDDSYRLTLNNTNALDTGSPTIWSSGGFNPTTTTFTIGTNTGTNGSGSTYIAYCWAEIEGFSRFGSYVANNSTSDGPFIYTGFKPAFILFKASSRVSDWSILDSSRSPYNVSDATLSPNLVNIETAGTSTSGAYADFLSNGFKIRGNSSAINDSTNTYIFAAFAESPFSYSNSK